MADTTSTLSPPPFREALSPTQRPLTQPLLLTDTWQRWMTLWWQQHTALWKQGQGGTWQPLDPTLSGLAALTGTADTFPYFSGTDVMALTGLSAYSRTLLDDGDAGTWRSTLGLGTLSTANAPLTVAQGGTGATDAATARGNLGLGTMSVQNANAVAITGGTVSATFVQSAQGFYAPNDPANDRSALLSQQNAGGTNRWAVNCAGTAPSYFGGTVHINGTMSVNSTTQLMSFAACAGAPDNRFVLRTYGVIYCDGIPYSGNPGPWQAFSDMRLKHNIHAIPHPLETMCRLHGIQYEWNDHKDGKPAGVHMGVIAQEVEDVLPQWVGELSGYKTTQLSKFEGLCIESFKELVQRVQVLEEQLACR
jgi:Chaperone of endosialidase